MKRNRILKVLIFLFIIFVFPKGVYADGVVFSVTKSGDNLKPKQEVTFTILASVPQNSQLQAYSLSFKTVDATANSSLTYLSGQGSNGVNVAPNGDKVSISYSGAAINSDLNPVATLRYRVNDNAKTGNVTLLLTLEKSCTAANMCSTNNSNLTLASLGSNANLKSLKIPNATLSPAFDPNVTEYKTTVKDLKEVTVNAVAAESSSRISISDNYKNLQKGDNLIKVQVTAENGTTKTYSINVNLTTTPTDEELLKADATLKKLKIKGYKLEFSSTEKKYFLEVPYTVTKLNITTEATNEKSEVKLDNPKLKIGKNTITITVTSEDKSSTETYTIEVTRKEQKKEVVQTCPDTTSTKEWIIYSISLFLSFTAGIVLGYFLCKKDVLKKIFQKRKEKKKKKEEEPVEIQTLSDTIELDTTKILEKAKKK